MSSVPQNTTPCAAQLLTGTRNIPRAPKKFLKSSAKLSNEQRAAIQKELNDLPELVKSHYTLWKDGATPTQLRFMAAQVLGEDVILHAATGAGKTGIAAGPHLLPSSKGKVTLFLSPLLSLHEEQVITFREEFGLNALAINSTSGGCSKDILKGVVAGDSQIVILSPEMMLSRRFIDGVLRKPEFGSRCLSVFIDEAHCVSHWGDSFRKKYASIGIVRAFLPKSTPLIAVSATLTPRVHKDLLTKLQMDKDTYIFMNAGNDRPNIAQVVRAMEHPMNSYRDLNFLLPDHLLKPEDIPKTFLYCDDIKTGDEMIDYLNSHIPPELRSVGLARPYNASMSKRYRQQVMQLFKAGGIRVLVCTDAAGMGCNIPDIDMVVQWKTPRNISSWVQRAGRAARAKGRNGLAVMLVEKSAFEAGALVAAKTTNSTPAPGRGRGRGRGHGRSRGGRGGGGAKRGSSYGVLHGQRRGTYSGAYDTITPINEPLEIGEDSLGEGIYVYIQDTVCRRRVLTKIFGNNVSDVPSLACCDLCNPLLLNCTRPGKPVAATRQQKIKTGRPLNFIRDVLYAWRRSVKQELFPKALWAPHAILDNATCEKLASIGPVKEKEMLELLLRGSWARWDDLGDRLFECLTGLPIPTIVPVPSKRAATRKRAPPIELDSAAVAASSTAPSAPQAKRPRTSVAQAQAPSQSVSTLAVVQAAIQSAAPQLPSTTASTSQPTASAPSYDDFWERFSR
ncbi:P-loop containing nucleoside triphosphate hydrolase protein [Crassisporium funariophilum]|nr:P-loop containing nucleoside triphosphate hydrolase protein [Crassisporium funariophilum]KAF8157864.1 P-loop containing nucleoside triphosphate hydrolase protein [Crassisporium funariophilum]